MEDDDATGAAASSARAPATGAPPPGWAGTLTNTGASGLATASLILLLLYLTCRFLWLYNKDAAQAAAAASSSSSRRQPTAAARDTSLLPAAFPPHRAMPLPLSPSPLLSIPVVFFVLHAVAPGPGGGERPECAVCLAEFGEREAGRMLPRCGHALHDECIAAWLRVSTTCPLCRAPVATE